MSYELIQHNKCHGGHWSRLKHNSFATQCDMTFSVFLPQISDDMLNSPALFWLSGLTCDDQNFVQKAHAEAMANDLGMILIVPDTSPRRLDIPGQTDSYDFGEAASFYLDATQSPWKKNYQMYSYIVSDLYELALSRYPIDPHRVGIFGHSMGGHGALIMALKDPKKFRSVSAFAPVCSPLHCPWGVKAFKGYLGEDRGDWNQYDACELIKEGARIPNILIDQGMDDEFLDTQLNPEMLRQACGNAAIDLELNYHQGYDHSYFFIRTFIEKHISYHHKHLNMTASVM